MPPKKHDTEQDVETVVVSAETVTATLPPAAASWDEGYRVGYDDGFADGRKAAQPEIPLFEQAKQLALDNPDASEAWLRGEISLLHGHRESEPISTSDVELIIGQWRRLRVVRQGLAEAQGTIGKPKTSLPAEARSGIEYVNVT